MSHSAPNLPVFITGTDTGIGKTLVSALLLAGGRYAGRDTRYWKPVQTGDDSDTRTVEALTGQRAGADPLYFFPEPMAPLRAAEKNGGEIREERIAETFRSFSSADWIIEGAGGLLVPLARPDRTMRTLAASLGARLVVVASPRLGAINHTLLTLEAARQGGLEVQALVWSGDEDPELENFMESWQNGREDSWKHPQPLLQLRVPRLGKGVSSGEIARLGLEIFTPDVVNSIFGKGHLKDFPKGYQ
jgi:dethiobiotin synthetase